MEFFGFKLKRKQERDVPAVVSPGKDDGTSITIGEGAYAQWQQVLDLEATIKNENELIRRYRETAMYPDVDTAIEDIINEAISAEEGVKPVRILLDDVQVPPTIKKKISEEFETICKLLKFKDNAHDIFRRWYVDGRIYYNILLNPDEPKNGIQELRMIDPRKIRKVKNVKKTKKPGGVEVVTGIEEYFLYNDKGLTEKTTDGVKLSTDAVVYVPSGRTDDNSGFMLSYLHKAVKVVNQLRMIEDALVIYRLSRAPERRIFYIDVGNLPKLKAEQYVSDIMNKYRNKIVYDATTGEVRDDRKHMSMMEDFWMPRREGGKGTEITTLQGGQNLQNLQDVEYFQGKLYQSLNVPVGRMQQTTGFNIGKSSEISRDEIKFAKFVARLRNKFAQLFTEALRVQLVAKGIISLEDWDDIKYDINYDFVRDNHFSELKDSEILQNRLATLQMMDPYIGRFYDPEWIRKNVLMQTDEEIAEILQRIEEAKAKADPAFEPTPLEQAQMQMQMEMQPDAGPEEDNSVQQTGLEMAKAEHQHGLDKDAAEHQHKLKKQEIKLQAQSRPKPSKAK
jgi:hypothetical protein